ncbi:MAG: hypothetical protein J1F20_03195 [Muribaculaceae bacterium]|nr:hypothetical protein [Muribaculaceae bacterium]
MYRTLKRSFACIICLVVLALSDNDAFAQRPKPGDDDQRKEWMAEMRDYKHEFYKKELDLTREQEVPFFKALDQMDDELFRVGEETRQLERKIYQDSDASDTEMESAARALFEQKKKEADIELKYFDEFKTTLTKRQLLKMKETERRFNRALLKYSQNKRK